MVDSSYFVLRSILLTSSCLMIVISCIQSVLAIRLKLAPIKRNTHFLLLSLAFNFLFTSIDPFGVYEIIPFNVVWVVTPFQGIFLGATFSMIVYSHFHAHFLTLSEHVPNALKFVLYGTNLVAFLCVLIGTSLALLNNQARFTAILDLGSCQFMVTNFICDIRGYTLVYRLIRQAQAAHPSKTKPSTKASQNSGTVQARPKSKSVASYDKTLTRMFRFHSIMLLGLGASFVYYLWSTLKDIQDQGPVAGPPDVYKFDPSNVGNKHLFATFNGWIIFTWWAWIPICASKEEEEQSSGSGHSHSSLTHSNTKRARGTGITVMYSPESQRTGHSGSASPTSPSPSLTPTGSRRTSLGSGALYTKGTRLTQVEIESFQLPPITNSTSTLSLQRDHGYPSLHTILNPEAIVGKLEDKTNHNNTQMMILEERGSIPNLLIEQSRMEEDLPTSSSYSLVLRDESPTLSSIDPSSSTSSLSSLRSSSEPSLVVDYELEPSSSFSGPMTMTNNNTTTTTMTPTPTLSYSIRSTVSHHPYHFHLYHHPTLSTHHESIHEIVGCETEMDIKQNLNKEIREGEEEEGQPTIFNPFLNRN